MKMISLTATTILTLVALSVISLFGVTSSVGPQVVGKNCTNATASTVCTAASHTICDATTQKCKCNVGYIGTKNCSAVIGMGCARANDCSNVLQHSTCVDKKCKCEIGYFGSAGQACSGIVGGKDCANNTDCSALLPHSKCGIGKKCACADGFNGTTCTAIPVPSLACKNDSDCTRKHQNTICDTKTTKCQCKSGYKGVTCAETSSATTALASIKTIMFIITVYSTVFWPRYYTTDT